MKVSIALTTYNGSAFLSEQLKSLRNQSRLPDELIITDDHSEDNTIEMLETFSEHAPFKVTIYQNPKRMGYTQNFSWAMSLCSGDLVFLCDQDDVWFPDKIKTILKIAQTDSHNLVFMHDAIVTDEKLIDKVSSAIKLSGKHRFLLGCTMAVKSEFLKFLIPIPKDFQGHDNWVFYLASGLKKLNVYHEALIYYRRHRKNTSPDILNEKALKQPFSSKLNETMFSDNKKYSLITSIKASLRKNILLIERINEYIKHNKICTQELRTAESFKEELISLKNSHQNRLNLLKTARSRRPITALKMYLSGQYKHFNGYKSVLRDLLIKQQ